MAVRSKPELPLVPHQPDRASKGRLAAGSAYQKVLRAIRFSAVTTLDGIRTTRPKLPGADDLGQRFTAGNKLAQDGKEEGLAKTADWGLWLQIEGAADDITVELFQKDPKT